MSRINRLHNLLRQTDEEDGDVDDEASEDECDEVENISATGSEQEVDDDFDISDYCSINLEELDEKDMEKASTSRKRKHSLINSKKSSQTSSNFSRREKLQGTNKYQWSTEVPECFNCRHQNLAFYSPTTVGKAKNITKPIEAWSLLLPDKMLQKIVQHTNEEIIRRQAKLESHQYYKETTLSEFKAFLGLCYFSGIFNTSKTNPMDLWTSEHGMTLYRATMPLNRFRFLCSSIRFDAKETREERKAFDRFAPIREVWSTFVNNCTKYYTPYQHCTIDEQLVSFRGKCRFKVYMKNKPDRYGLKFVMMNDAKTGYMISAEPYTGVVKTSQETDSSYYIKKLSESIYSTNRCITMDNCFTSISISDEMLSENSLFTLATVRKNLPEMPEEFNVAVPIGTARFAFESQKTLLSYTPKKNKVILLLSTLHNNANINEQSNKPEMFELYNATRGGTELFDMLCRQYTTARKTYRWPLRIFYAILDQCAVNSLILYNLNSDNKMLNHRRFLHELVNSLVQPHFLSRLHLPTLSSSLRHVIKEILHINIPEELKQRSDKLEHRERCAFCPRKQDKKTTSCCYLCTRAICSSHKRFICTECCEDV